MHINFQVLLWIGGGMGSDCIPAKAAATAGGFEARALTRIEVALRAEGSEGMVRLHGHLRGEVRESVWLLEVF